MKNYKFICQRLVCLQNDLFFLVETLPSAARGAPISPRAVALLQDTWGETHRLTNLLAGLRISDLISAPALHHSHALNLHVSPFFLMAGCRQFVVVCAWCLREGQSVDDRLWEDGPAARLSDPWPQDSLGGGQQGGRLPVRTRQPHRHLRQYASTDALKGRIRRRHGRHFQMIDEL